MQDALLHGLEQTLASFVLWNYNADNDPTFGDSWNGENFSVFTPATVRMLESTGKVAGVDSDGYGAVTAQALLVSTVPMTPCRD